MRVKLNNCNRDKLFKKIITDYKTLKNVSKNYKNKPKKCFRLEKCHLYYSR